jgi:hypothetical protein
MAGRPERGFQQDEERKFVHSQGLLSGAQHKAAERRGQLIDILGVRPRINHPSGAAAR